MITVPTVLVSGTGTKSHARQNETENASGKWGQPFVMTNARKCAEKLPYGNSPIKFDKDQSAYLSTAARSVCHDEFLQYLYPNGLETTPVMVIFWKFDDVKTVEDRFYSAVQSGEKVTWTIHYHNEIITKSQVWRFSDSMGNVRKKFGSHKQTKFSDDDGAWGGGSTQVNGNTGSPSDYYGQANWNGVDSACNNFYVNGKAQASNTLQNVLYAAAKNCPTTTTTTTTTKPPLLSVLLKTFMLPEFSSWVIKDAGGKKIVCKGSGQTSWYSTIKVNCKLVQKKSYRVTCRNKRVGGWAGGYLQVKGKQLCIGYQWSQGPSWEETFAAR